MTRERSLRRSMNERVIAGVCGGLAAYLKIDPVVVRVIFVLLMVFGGGGLLAYIILWIVVPEDQPWKTTFSQPQPNVGAEDTAASNNTATSEANAPEKEVFAEAEFVPGKRSNGQLITGLILIGLGIIFLAAALLPRFSVGDFWPVLIIVLGFIILRPALKKKSL